MAKSITDAGRETVLYMHALTAALACSSQGVVPMLAPLPERDPSPAAQRQLVLEHLDGVLDQLDAIIRSKKAPPTGVPMATMARLLIERGEKFDAVTHTYTPGPGFDTFINSLVADAINQQIMNAPEHVQRQILDLAETGKKEA